MIAAAMASQTRRRALARADRVLPGLWRRRLPLPWPGVPHVNAWAIAAGCGVLLVDTGLDEPGALLQLERALGQAGLRLEHVRLLVCTHAHSDHYGLAGPIVRRAGCELRMHPNHAHMTRAVADPERELLDGVELESDLGAWHVYETPGHAPSHVVLHQPERRLLLSGDHLIGRVSLYYDYGWSPDPAGEFLRSLDVVEPLDVDLILTGHGRPARDLRGLVGANRREVRARIARVRDAIAGEPRTPFEIVPRLLGVENPSTMMLTWGLSETLCYLSHLELEGEATRVKDADPARWRLV
jgi:glyoxylase-like metal-dependent hydrolase (beta-lactamase superfamily II)